MRWLFAFVCVGMGFILLGGVGTLCFWVPRFKAEALEMGAELPGWQVLLITLSDITVKYFYVAIPAVLVICFGLCRAAFASENESRLTES
ncbi:MAG: hypothetical protein FJ302_15600 [Planctomycetes bacterium]|nr:hypothetical protein [Planctomycetota bacterium]